MSSYNPSIPLNSDSPSNFPAQSQANFGRLQTIIEADHVFNLTAAGNDGYHNLIHMTIQAPSGVLANTGRLYVKTQGSQVELFYMDDAGTERQITPFYDSVPFKVNGNTISLAPNATAIIFASPSYDYTGIGWAFYQGTNLQTTNVFQFINGVGGDEHRLDSNGPDQPSLFYSGLNLVVRNNDAVSRVITYSLMINRL